MGESGHHVGTDKKKIYAGHRALNTYGKKTEEKLSSML